jgi:hypothetical protein
VSGRIEDRELLLAEEVDRVAVNGVNEEGRAGFTTWTSSDPSTGLSLGVRSSSNSSSRRGYIIRVIPITY